MAALVLLVVLTENVTALCDVPTPKIVYNYSAALNTLLPTMHCKQLVQGKDLERRKYYDVTLTSFTNIIDDHENKHDFYHQNCLRNYFRYRNK